MLVPPHTVHKHWRAHDASKRVSCLVQVIANRQTYGTYLVQYYATVCWGDVRLRVIIAGKYIRAEWDLFLYNYLFISHYFDLSKVFTKYILITDIQLLSEYTLIQIGQ